MEGIFNIPNIITFLRIMLIPVIVCVFYLPWKSAHLWCAVVFFIASITDWLDGMLARKLRQVTRFGAFIDPVADKLIVAVALAMLIEYFHSIWITVPAMIIIGREIVISALREWMAELGRRENVAVSLMGKYKTMFQMTSICLLFLSGLPIHNWVAILGLVLLHVAAVLTMISMCVYAVIAYRTVYLDKM